MARNSILNPEVVRTLAHGSMGTSYAAIGTPLNYPARAMLIQNLTNGNLMFSFDGTDDHFPIAADSFLLLDISSNRIDDSGLFLSANETLYVKHIENPTTGSVYFTTFYGADHHIA